MKEIIKEKELREANDVIKANMLKQIAKGEAVFQKQEKTFNIDYARSGTLIK